MERMNSYKTKRAFIYSFVFLVLTMTGFFLYSSQAFANIFVKTPSLQMEIEKIGMDPIPLELDEKQ